MSFAAFLRNHGFVGRTAEEYERAAKTLFQTGWETRPALVPIVPTNVGRSRLIVLRRACALAAQFRALPNPWPLTQLPRQKKTLPRWFSATEYDTFRLAVEKRPPPIRSLILLALKLGLRARRELLSFTRPQLESALATGVLRFQRKGDKTGELPVNAEVRKYITTLLASPARPSRVIENARELKWKTLGQLLSGGSVSAAYQTYRKMIQEIAHEAGLSAVKTHTLRHSFATALVRKKVNIKVIQQALGHEQPATTMIYAHADLSDVAQALE
jgi:site-specific recombinase XerD